MKKILLSAFVIGSLFTAAITTTAFAKPVIQIIDSTPVKIEDLPEAVKKTLVEKFAEWKPTAAFLVSGENEHYKIEVIKGEEKQFAKIKSDGSIVEGQSTSEFAGIQKETPVKVEELPDAVKKTIAEKFEGWAATAASHVSGEAEHYKVELTKEENKSVVKIGKDGTLMD